MSQASKLPTLKKIVLTTAQMIPPAGSEPLGALPDGRVIWEGPIFDGNPWFQQGAVSDDGHPKSPRIGPDGEHVYRRNKATGEKITPSFNSKRSFSLKKFVMYDAGNGNAGPRPVPGMSEEEKARREAQANFESYSDRMVRAAMAEGMTPEELVSAIKTQGGVQPDPEVAALRAEIAAMRESLAPVVPGEGDALVPTTLDVEPSDERVAAVKPRNVKGQDEDPTVAAVRPKKKATRKKRAPKKSS